jgi:hypothetical protein
MGGEMCCAQRLLAMMAEWSGSDFFLEVVAVDAKPNESERVDDLNEPSAEAEVVEAVQADPMEALRAELAQLDARGTAGAGWFFWIAALSLVNSVILLSGGDRHFVVGLGVTMVADVVAKTIAEENPDIAGTAKGIAFAFDLFVAAVVCVFGWLSRRGILPVFALGMFLYLLDGLIYVLVGEWMSVGFHAFVLFSMWSGFTAYRQMKAIKADLERQLAAGINPAI